MDTVLADDSRLPTNVDAQPLVQAAVALHPALRKYHEEIEREQRMPSALFEQLREAGFYKMVIPRALGGLQVDPLTYYVSSRRWPRVSARSAGTSEMVVSASS